ncbi:ATP-binding protein [Sphingoaurantiacus capsulatus]|uniref:histidine kinase n=1 Tax=Sphingoaurantiacus capsulatus TaxID=1771310 RepID=A0ABV7XFC5_9SPHN
MTPLNPSASTPLRWRMWRRRFNRWVTRVDFYPRLEIGFALLATVLGITGYAVLTGERAPAEGFDPWMVTLLLVAILVPLMGLIVLIARRFAILLSKRREGQAGARLHVRLVGLFAAIAAVPTLLVVVFASLLFQFGVQFWFSDRARTVLENADRVAQAYVQENKQRIVGDILPMAADLRANTEQFGLLSKDFRDNLDLQVLYRNLTEAAVFSPQGEELVVYAASGLDNRPLRSRILTLDLQRAQSGEAVVIASASDRVEAIARIDPIFERYVYVSRKVSPQVLNQVARTQNALSEYKSLIERSRAMQWRFNLMLVVVSLLILAAAIWFALWLANRLVAPMSRLVDAAERVGAGDFGARVPVRGTTDEMTTLARTFNRMTTQLDAQKNALVSANEQLDRRREFTEAVLSRVSAGVLSIGDDGIIRIANQSACELLERDAVDLSGVPLTEAVPELADLLDEATGAGHARGEARIARGADTQTLAVQVAAFANGFVLTFDDISQQLSDQRRAAWADVARRIAHEIKNPLTPIQLSAERLQRKYGKQITEDPETFGSLTGTIIRQVGDLRRMVDEFSSFARMPKPVFRPEPVLDIARQALFMQEVAHPAVTFAMKVPETLPLLVCDRRQIAQSLTNLLKNAAEAVAARQERDGAPGHVSLSVEASGDRLVIAVTDNGVGLPPELRDRITEPYVTTRVRGTGLGLAIVKKIVEEHGGTLDLADAPGGGTVARMIFDPKALIERMEADAGSEMPEPKRGQG